MSYSIIQVPASASLAQSPVIFSVSSSTNVAAAGFQYIAELTIWSGSVSGSGSGETWTLAKYPSTNGFTGIFDCSRIINSTQTELLQQNSSSVQLFKIDSYPRYLSGSVYVTGSHITSSTYIALDGYQIFPETIGQQMTYGASGNSVCPYFPILVQGPATQSVFADNLGRFQLVKEDFGQGPNFLCTSVKYVGSNGEIQSYAITGPLPNTNDYITSIPIGPAEYDFPLTGSLNWFTIQPFHVDDDMADPIRFDITCQQKYPNIRIKFKNRYRGFNYINMDMINRKSFSSDRRTYQPQLGSWGSTTLSYNEYDSQTLNYIVDAKQNIICNTNWLDEGWNEILKQLLVSDEIYWCQENTEEVKPLTIVTSNIQFKTGVNDHLIQYQFEFQYGQGYKLII